VTAVVSASEAVRLLREGAVIAIPTDTVYGLAASLNHPTAIARLFALKRRPSTAPVPVLVGSLEVVDSLGVVWPELARRLSDAFWPGALTIVVPAPRGLANAVGSSLDTVGFRLPDDALLLEVLRACGPLAVSSANEHGDLPCQSADDVIDAFEGGGGVDAVLDGGERTGSVSTVIEIAGTSWRVLREGSISAEALGRVLASPPKEGPSSRS